MSRKAKCDIEFVFKRDGYSVYFLIVASSGSGFETQMLREFKEMLKDGWTVEAIKHEPSRFTPEDGE